MITYLLKALATDLQTHFSTNDSEIDVMPDGRPKPQCGDRFISIYAASISNPEPINSPPRLRMATDVICTITVRPNNKPKHSAKKRYIDDSDSIMKTAVSLAERVHGNYSIIGAAKTLLDASGIGGAYTGVLAFRSMDGNPQLVGPEWFYADWEEGNMSEVGLVVNMSCGTVRWTNNV